MSVLEDRHANVLQAEVSEKVHLAITDIAGRLLATPEFMAGLGKTFFGRSFPNGGSLIINDGVSFQIGDYKYNAKYRAETRRFVSEEAQLYSARMDLRLLRSDPSLDERHSLVNRLDLFTFFDEDQDGNPVLYKFGSATISDRTGDDHDPDSVLNKIPTVFPELYRSLKL